MAARTTTTKTAATTPEPPEPITEAPAPVYDFDSWSEEAETKAIAALEPKIKHIIVENRFIGRFEDGTIIELPLRLSVDDVDALTTNNEGAVDQLKGILTRSGATQAAA